MNKTCSFILNGDIQIKEDFIDNIYDIIENLVNKENVGKFLFYLNNKATNECLSIVSKLKNKYSHITRVKVKSLGRDKVLSGDFGDFDELMVIKVKFEFEIEKILRKMIDESDYCFFHYDKYVKFYKTGAVIPNINRSLYYYALENNKIVYNLYKKRFESFSFFE